MITILRHFLVDSWFGRVLALVVFLCFVGLGGTFLGLNGGGLGMLMGRHGVVMVGSEAIEPTELARAIRMQVNFALQNGMAEAELQNPQIQDNLSREALRNLIIAKEVSQEAKRKGLVITDDAIREKIFEMPEFANKQGQFDPAKMEDLLKRNNLSHAFLINHTRQELENEAMYLGIGQTAEPSPDFIQYLVHFYSRIRVADIYHLPFNEGHTPAEASDAVLKRFYLNHLDLFREPEFRHARIVIMTPETVLKTIQVPDEIVHKIYDMQLKTNARDYNLPETRSVQVLTFSDEEKAKEALDNFQKGQNWDWLQKHYSEAIPAEISDARQADFPDSILAKAVFEQGFSKGKGNIVGPVKTVSGWSLVHILSIKAPHYVRFEEARPRLVQEIQASEAGIALRGKVKLFEEAVASSTDLNKIPSDLGAVPFAALLNEKGTNPEGEIVPVPGTDSLRLAVIHQIFSQDQKTLPHVIVQPDGSAFALIVDEIHPSEQKSFEQAHTQILLAWQQEQKKHDANKRATELYLAAKNNLLRQAVEKSGDDKNFQKDVNVSLLSPPENFPSLVTQSLLRLPVGGARMIEEENGFWVMRVNSEHLAPQEEQDTLKKRLLDREKLMLGNDVAQTLAVAYMREKMPRHFNMQLFQQAKDVVFSREAR